VNADVVVKWCIPPPNSSPSFEVSAIFSPWKLRIFSHWKFPMSLQSRDLIFYCLWMKHMSRPKNAAVKDIDDYRYRRYFGSEISISYRYRSISATALSAHLYGTRQRLPIHDVSVITSYARWSPKKPHYVMSFLFEDLYSLLNGKKKEKWTSINKMCQKNKD